MLAECSRVDFAYLRNALELTDGNLSRHLQVLEAAGHVRVEKTYSDRRPRTWLSATAQGRAALAAEIAALRALIQLVDGESS